MRPVCVIHRASIYRDRQDFDSYQYRNFIQYGTDVKRFGDEFLSVTSAVVEFNDGTVSLIPVKGIKFL